MQFKMIKIRIIISFICILLLGCGTAMAKAIEDADIKELFPQAFNFESVAKGGEAIYYNAKDKEGNLLGVVFKASGKSYEGQIETLVGMLKDGTITEIRVISENDTSGLSALVTGPQFTDQFKNVSDLSGIQAVTGATVSSKAIINSVKKKAAEIKGYIK